MPTPPDHDQRLKVLLKEGILERVVAHNFVHPIRHGARVRLPGEIEE